MSTITYETIKCSDISAGDRLCFMEGFPIQTVTTVTHDGGVTSWKCKEEPDYLSHSMAGYATIERVVAAA